MDIQRLPTTWAGDYNKVSMVYERSSNTRAVEFTYFDNAGAYRRVDNKIDRVRINLTSLTAATELMSQLATVIRVWATEPRDVGTVAKSSTAPQRPASPVTSFSGRPALPPGTSSTPATPEPSPRTRGGLRVR